MRRFLPLIALGAALAVGYALGVQDYLSLSYLGEQRETLVQWVANRPVTATLAFMGIYTAAVALSLPAASVLTIFAGFLFGWLQGGVDGRCGGNGWRDNPVSGGTCWVGGLLRDRLGSKAEAFAEGFRKDAFGYLLVLRLAPVFPFFLVNIAPAFFNVKTRDYVLATALGIVPGTFAFAWLGEGVGIGA